MSTSTISMDKAVAAEIEKFRKDTATSAEDIIFKMFPAKILELNQRIAMFSSNDPSAPFHPSHAKAHSDINVYPSPSENGGNPHIRVLHEVVKKECEELAGLIVKLWVTLTMPRIEDGDNFGVQVQEECLSELHRAQDSAYNLRDIPRQDYLARAKLASKRIKYPHIEDYKFALQEHDEKQIYFCRQRIIDIRNLYAALMDVLQKNIAKLRVPKGNNRTAMY
ncbi:proteasome activator pa28, REG alpha/beta subunit [Marasmius fiardii PR-910]|nr:proteasome activator pa28, REG alpha/beta subunit [Marasmius fiardii PR-910]